MSTSYSNAGGSGNRTASITATTDLGVSGTFSHIINGNTTENDWWFNGEAVSGKKITFDFGVGASKIIDAAKFYASGVTPQGTWQWFSSDDGTTYTARGSTFVMNGASGGAEFTEPAGNTVGARYWQMRGSAGSTNSGPFFREVEFRIDDSVAVTGTLAATEGADVAAFSYLPMATGTLAATEARDSMFFSAGAQGTIAATEAPDALAFTFDVPMGEMILTEAPDTVAFLGVFRRHTAVVVVVSNT